MPSFELADDVAGAQLRGPVAFCDGAAGPAFRDGIDLELSHWVPNRTPARLKADTSTGICMKLVADPPPGDRAVVNDHVDTDGVLSVFTLVQPELALRHRQLLEQAAGMGDFMGWGGLPAQRLYQRLGSEKARLRQAGLTSAEVYRRCFDLVAETLEQPAARPEEEDAGMAALRVSLARIESGEISRRLAAERLASYEIPGALAAGGLEAALHIPAFDAPLSAATLLVPQARARDDAERMQLVSTASGSRWFHDLWYPGYVWAETPDSWRPAGLVPESSNSYRVEAPAWSEAVRRLQRAEAGRGRWVRARQLTPFQTLAGRRYPVVLSFLRGGRPAPSTLAPGRVAAELLDAGVVG